MKYQDIPRTLQALAFFFISTHFSTSPSMSAEQQSANKVLLRLVEPDLTTSDIHRQASNYEVHLAKYHSKSQKHFYCNLSTKTTSWDAPVGTEEATADGKSADDIWKEINQVCDEVRLATEAVEKAKSDLIAAQQKKVSLLEGLLPRKNSGSGGRVRGRGNQQPEARGGVYAPATADQSSAFPKTDSVKVSGGVSASKLSESNAALSLSADASKPRVPEGAAPGLAAAQVQRVYVNWATQHKPDPDISGTQLQEAFKQFGAIHDAFVVGDPLLKKNKPYGFVQFKNAESAAKAVAVKSVVIGAVKAKTAFAKDA
jgi:hypothetical protein